MANDTNTGIPTTLRIREEELKEPGKTIKVDKKKKVGQINLKRGKDGGLEMHLDE
jgi:hypothetical protein